MKNQELNQELKKDVNKVSTGRLSARFSQNVRPDHIGQTLKRLVSFTGGSSFSFLIVFLLVAMTSLMDLYVPRQIGYLVDLLAKGQLSTTFIKALGLLAGLYVMITLFSWLTNFVLIGATQKVLKVMRDRLFGRLGQLPIKYFDTHGHGDLVSRLTNDVDSLNTVFTQSTTALIRSGIMVVGSVIMMLRLNVMLCFCVMGTVPLIYFLSRLIAKRTLKLYKQQRKYMGAINSRVEETVYGLDVIQTYNQQEYFQDVFDKANDELYKYGRQAQLYTGLLMPVLNVINNLTYGIIGLVGGYLAVSGLITVGVVASFIAYSRQFIRPLNELASIYNSLMSAIAGLQRVFEVLDELPEKDVHEDNKSMDGTIDFDHVSFSYVEGVPVLKDLNLRVAKGSKIAIVGPTGAGKTTIVNLITRFYDVETGEIRIGGESLKNISRKTLRKHIGFVLQDTYLFSGTIYDNIGYGNPEASREDIIRSATIAGAHAFISKLPQQYESKLIYGGMNLSQGERQLITIARAILMDPKILILDEASSSVDLATEKIISKSLTDLMEGKTSFIIAHRLSTIIGADRILVLDDGQVVEAGTHEELLIEDGLYRRMFKLQTDGV